MKISKDSMTIVFLFSAMFADSFQRVDVNIESGMATVFYSDIRIPGTTGTLISFSDELETDPAFFVRGRLTYYINRTNAISLLIAPLTLKASGSVDRDVFFEGVTFAANTPLNTVYRFNSYRLSYEHFWSVRESVGISVGLTAKIRAAAISIADSVHTSEKTNVGFVPLIRFSLVWHFARPFSFLLEGDGLAAPQGRAEDVSCTLLCSITDQVSLRLGYRVLEGGSDVDEVYSFTWVNYFLAGTSFSF